MEINELKDKLQKLIEGTDYQILIYKKNTTLYELLNK